MEEDHGLYASDTVTLFHIIASSHMSFLLSCLLCLLTYIASLYFSIQSVSHLVSILGFLYLLFYVYMSLRPFSCVLLQIYIQSVYQTIHVSRHLIVAPFVKVSPHARLLHNDYVGGYLTCCHEKWRTWSGVWLISF